MKEKMIEIEKYANENNIPIVEKETIAFIMKYIKEKKVKNILEIGSSIGYSSILMATVLPEGGTITTIENDESKYMECLKNVKKFGMQNVINVVYQDALEVNLTEVEYDLIFIDTIKGQYIKYFEKFQHFLAVNGVIITDNLKIHNTIDNKKNIDSKNILTLTGRIEGYIDFLKENDDFSTKFYDVGDGISISIRKEDEEFNS